MSAVLQKPTPPQSSTHAASGDDPFVRVANVLVIRRGHPPVGGVGPRQPEPVSSDCCRVLERQDVQQFHIRDAGGWADYREIKAAFTHAPSEPISSHIAPFSEEFVFAPYKLVIDESERPLRVAVTTRPVYPKKGKLGILQADTPLAWLYLAAGVLNSALGQAYYRREAERLRGHRSKASDGVRQRALERVPLAHRTADVADRVNTAHIAYQIAVLYDVQTSTGRDLSQLLTGLRKRLLAYVDQVLKLPEGQAEELIREVQDLRLPDAGDDLFTPLEDLPPLPPLQLLEQAESSRLEDLRARSSSERLSEGELDEWERLVELEDWEAALSADLPEDVSTFPGLRRERVGGDDYEYYAIGEYIVIAPGVCGGRPTFKGTRLDVLHILPYLLAGEDARAIAERFGDLVGESAIEEARRLLDERGPGFFEREHADRLEKAS